MKTTTSQAVPYGIPVHKKNVTSTLQKYVTQLTKTVDGTLNGTMGIKFKNRLSTVTPADIIRAIAVEGDITELPAGRSIKNAVLEMCITSEKVSPGSSFIALLAFVTRYKELTKLCAGSLGAASLVPDINILNGGFLPTKKECYRFLKLFTKDDYACGMVINAYEMTGCSGQILLNTEQARQSTVSLNRGCKFDVGYEKDFFHVTKGGIWKANDARALIVDGIIESVSEIHHVLEYFSDQKIPLAIFARGFSEEVMATIIVNNMRQTLRIAPVRVPFDALGANMLVDIAVACSGDVVSSLKGQLISSIDPYELPKIKTVEISKDSLSIENDNSSRLKHHLVTLIKKRDNILEKDARIALEKQRFIDKRISSLSANSAHIFVGPEHGDNTGILMDRVDTCIRLVKTISSFGLIETSILNDSNNLSIQQIGQTLSKYGYDIWPIRTMHVGIENGIRTAELLCRSPIFVDRTTS